MGTTLTAALIYRDRVYLAHVGDSRAYLIRPGLIRRLTLDHSVVEELLRWGAISEAEATHHPYRSVLTRALGTEANIRIDLVEEVFLTGDYLLLCTDGLTNLVSDQEIYDIIERATSLETALDQLVGLALARGGYDNITVALGQLEYRGEIS
jgi:serine/threonine protein phosphatase PrpC